jgi:hypothetical protein
LSPDSASVHSLLHGARDPHTGSYPLSILVIFFLSYHRMGISVFNPSMNLHFRYLQV